MAGERLRARTMVNETSPVLTPPGVPPSCPPPPAAVSSVSPLRPWPCPRSEACTPALAAGEGCCPHPAGPGSPPRPAQPEPGAWGPGGLGLSGSPEEGAHVAARTPAGPCLSRVRPREAVGDDAFGNQVASSGDHGPEKAGGRRSSGLELPLPGVELQGLEEAARGRPSSAGTRLWLPGALRPSMCPRWWTCPRGDSGSDPHVCLGAGPPWPRPPSWGGGGGAGRHGGARSGRLGLTPAGRGTQGAPEPTILGHLLQLPDAGLVFIAASGQRGGSSQQEPRRRQPLTRPTLAGALTPLLRRRQVPSLGLARPRRRPGATFCLAGASAFASLARTLSVSAAPVGIPLALSARAVPSPRSCLLLLSGSCPGAAGVSGRPAGT